MLEDTHGSHLTLNGMEFTHYHNLKNGYTHTRHDQVPDDSDILNFIFYVVF